MFTLHERLAQDTYRIVGWPLSEVLLMNDSRFPWVILVPRREGLTEPFDLSPADQAQLLDESMHLGTVLKHHFNADKLNIAALGNVVPQLHIHHIVRFTTDVAWPAPVWGVGQAEPYDDTDRDSRLSQLRAALAETFRNADSWP